MKSNLLCLFLLCCISPLFSLEEIGKVISVSGEVLFDVQGTGTFIKLQAGDALYDQSVLKMGGDGQASITVNNKEHVLPPLTIIKLADLLSADLSRRGIDQGVYRQLLDFLEAVFKRIFANVDKKEKGTIESKQAAGANPDFLTEQNLDNELLLTAKANLLKKAYVKALVSLAAIKNPSALNALPGEFFLLKGLSYFLLGYFRQADEFLKQAAGQVNPEARSAEEAGMLLFLPGVTAYFFKEDNNAISYFKKVLLLKEAGELKPYGYYFLCHALLGTGQKAEAKTYLLTALDRFKNHPLNKEWTRLLTGL